MTVPLCPCHNEPMRWAKRPNLSKGGLWRCAVKQREYDRRYNTTPKGRDRNRSYRNSPAGALNKQLLEMTRVRVHY